MALDFAVVVIPGLVVGIIFGFVLQRGRFCRSETLPLETLILLIPCPEIYNPLYLPVKLKEGFGFYA